MCINSHLVGIIANQGVISEKEAVKTSHFIQLCCERDVPLIFLQNTTSDVLEASSGSETDGKHESTVVVRMYVVTFN